MKKLLVNFLITLSNYLSAIAWQLDKRYRYFHIDLLPEKNQANINYDTIDTVNTLKEFNQEGGVDRMLDSVGAKKIEQVEKMENINNKDNVSRYNKISTGDILIAWEHYKTNYVEVDRLKEEHQSFDNDELDDDEDDDRINIMEMMPNIMRFGDKPMHYTPWGKFEADNPLSPVNLYDLRAVHFKGFTCKSIKNFNVLMSSIEGVAIWGQIDPYFIVIAPAKSYDYAEVKANVESAIYKALNIEVKSETKTTDLQKYITDAGIQSENLFKNGIDNFTIVFPDENFTVEVLQFPDESKVKSVCKLMEQIKNLIVFKNGEIYEC